MATLDQFMVAHHEEHQGPYSEKEVRDRLLDGRISLDDLACRNGHKEWVPLRELLDTPPNERSPFAGSAIAVPAKLHFTAKGPFGPEKQIEIDVPLRGRYEVASTLEQQNELETLGVTNAASIGRLGAGQASYVIDQVTLATQARSGSSVSKTVLAAVLVAVLLGGAVFMFLGTHDSPTLAGKLAPLPASGQPAPATANTISRAAEASERSVIPGLSPQKLYDILGLQERGFSFEPPEPSNPGTWHFRLSIDGKTYEITVHGQNSNSIDWVEVKIDVMQGYDLHELTQSFFASVAGMGSNSEAALAAQDWVKEHINKNDAATFGALDFQIVSKGNRQRKLIISPSKAQPMGGAAPTGKR
jgi:hypothetical protein